LLQGTCENSRFIEQEGESESESAGPYAAAQACNCTCPTLTLLPPANATNTTATSRRGLGTSSLYDLRELEEVQPPATVAANCVLTCSRFCNEVSSCGCGCNATTNATTPAPTPENEDSRRALHGLLPRRKNLAQTKLDVHRQLQEDNNDPVVPGQTPGPTEGETEGAVAGCATACPVLCSNRDGTTLVLPEGEVEDEARRVLPTQVEMRGLAAPGMETELQKEQRMISTFNRHLQTLPIFITPGYGCQRYGASPTHVSLKCPSLSSKICRHC
jgi:hypothetical protein